MKTNFLLSKLGGRSPISSLGASVIGQGSSFGHMLRASRTFSSVKTADKLACRAGYAAAGAHSRRHMSTGGVEGPTKTSSPSRAPAAGSMHAESMQTTASMPLPGVLKHGVLSPSELQQQAETEHEKAFTPLDDVIAGVQSKKNDVIDDDVIAGVHEQKNITAGLTGMQPVHVPIAPCRDPCVLRNQPYVPKSDDALLPECVPNATPDFPYRLVLPDELRQSFEASEDGGPAAFAAWAKKFYDEHLSTHGCIVFSNTPLGSMQE